jgi:hypothetical protein
MEAVRQDLRRYVWCWGYVLYRVGILIPSYLEDADGALAAGQMSVAVRACRELADECCLAWLLASEHVRPLPPPQFRAPMSRIAVPEELRADADRLFRGASPDDREQVSRLVSAAHRLAAATAALVGGDFPNILTPEGYFPALKLGGEWLRLAEKISEQDFLPDHWKPD